jgi:hypothetical protein
MSIFAAFASIIESNPVGGALGLAAFLVFIAWLRVIFNPKKKPDIYEAAHYTFFLFVALAILYAAWELLSSPVFQQAPANSTSSNTDTSNG